MQISRIAHFVRKIMEIKGYEREKMKQPPYSGGSLPPAIVFRLIPNSGLKHRRLRPIGIGSKVDRSTRPAICRKNGSPNR